MELRKVCPQCGAFYGADSRFCSVDGATLVLERPAEDLVGSVIADRYHILERIGEGGMGHVFLAEHVRIKRKSAIKIMREAMTSDPVAVSRFHREAENASQISHPNVAAVYDFGETPDGLVYIAMEYIPGRPMAAVLEREGALNPARVGDIIGQAADALSAAHGLGILHRDLKPDNIMLTTTRWGTDLAKLVDFGISRAMSSATQQFTTTGVIVGTPDYMSPEQLTGEALDPRSDQYALALIAYIALTATLPFPSGNSKDALLTRLTSKPRPLTAANGDVAWPAALQGALDRALDSDVANRYPDVLEFARDFEAGIAEMPASEAMLQYQQALRLRYSTPTRSPATTTPVYAVPSAELTPASPVAALDTPPQPLELRPQPGDATAVALPATGTSERTMRKRQSPVRLVIGGAAALGLTVLLFTRLTDDGSARAPQEGAAAASMEPNSLPAIPAGPVADSGTRTALPLDGVALGARSGVFPIFGSAAQGLAFLVDPAGIVLTSAEFADRGADALLQLGDVRVTGRVMEVDRGRGVAALRIPMRHCRRCDVLRLATDSAGWPRAGDSVIAAARSAPVRGAVSQLDAATLQASLRLRDRSSGAPVLASNAQVVGVALRTGRGQTTFVPASALIALHARALRQRAQVPPNEAVLPSWPAAPIAREETRRAVARSDAELEPYRAGAQGYALLLMTPQVMAWRQARATQAYDARRLAAIDSLPFRFVDPVQAWRPWNDYLVERRAVVVIHATPEGAAYPFLNPYATGDVRGGDVAEIRLLRDGAVVVPIETARIPSGVTSGGAGDQRRRLPNAGIAAYSPLEFALRADGRFPQFQLEVVDGRNQRRTNVAIPEAALRAIARDLSGYQR
ncbi:MAG: protein kinase domain-containing protein [Gemmatimonadaceae bacterium]